MSLSYIELKMSKSNIDRSIIVHMIRAVWPEGAYGAARVRMFQAGRRQRQ